MATSLAIREIQTVYNNIRRDYPEVDSTKQFTSSFLSSLNSSVTNEELSPREAMQVLQVAASSLKSGTGAWADISDVQTAVSGMMANWENKAANQANLALQQKKQKEELFSEGVRDVFEKRIADGTFTSLNNTTDLEAIGEQVATAVYPEMGVSKDTMRRKVDEIRIETLERIENSEKFFTENPLIENLIDAGEPEEALVYLNANKNAITRETYEKYLKKVNEVNDVKKFLDEGGYSKKLSDIEKIARDRISPDSFITRMMGSQDPLTADDQEKIADLQTYGESTFRELSTQLLRTKLKENPELRQNQVERESAAMDAVNEAWVETQKRMSSYLGKENAVLDAEQSKQKQQLKTQKAALYGTSLRKIDLLEDALDNMKISQDPTSKEIIYETLTTPQNVDFKMRLRQAPLELNSLADKMGRVNPSDPEYNQLKESYNTILGIAGYGAQSIIDGKTEHGMPVNVENIKQNWKNVPIFRNNEEYEAAWKEAREAVAPVTKTKNLLDFVKQAEGFAPKAKWDNKQWSVGYGTRGSQGETLSEVEASARLEQELEGHASAVDTAAEAAGMILTEGQRNALISFAFNTGDSNAISVIKRFAGDPAAMKKKMMEFNKETINGQLVFSQGLQNRRLKEIALFDSTDMTPAMLSAEPSTLEKLFSILGIDTPDEEREFNQRQSMFSRQRTP
jgi:GH24 family phage-related lysozyme (muramidase)